MQRATCRGANSSVTCLPKRRFSWAIKLYGSFRLNHTFDSQYQIARGSTQNLLDYTAGTGLVKHQWDAIHDTGLVIGMFERDEDAAMMADCWFYWTFISGWKVSEYAGCRPMDEKLMNSIGYFSIRQKIELDKKKALEAKAIEETNRQVQAQIASYEYNKSQNLFYIIYQLSPFSSGTQAAINISNGEYGWATINAAITLIGGSELKALMTSGRSLTKAALGEVWKEGSFNRNVFFKNTLFKNLYKTADDIAAARYSLFPVIDFLENGTGIAFRTVDDFATSEVGLLKTIDELSNAKAAGCIAGATGEVKVTGARLDIGVPGGSATELPEKISTYATGKGINVRVFEIVEEGGEIGVKTTFANGVGEIASLKKLAGKASSENITWKNLDELNIIWANQNSNVLSTAKSFANETGTSLYDAVLSNGYYVKFDLNDGRILLGNTNGTYHAFAIVNDASLSTFKSSVFNVSDEVFNTKLTQFLKTNTDKLKVLSGVVSRQLTIGGKTVILNTSKVNTIIGGFRPDIAILFDEFGSFKNVGLGETQGGINILNKPDYYYDASTWWNAYNKPWLDKAITRGDDIYLATIPTKVDDIIKNGKLSGAYSEELNYLAIKNYKPINISATEWANIKIWLGH